MSFAGFDTWQLLGVGGGSAALTFLAASPSKTQSGESTLRFNILPGDDSLVGDVRFIGGVLSAGAAMWARGTTKKVLNTVAAASLLSLLQTELVRWKLRGKAVAAGGTVFPRYGAMGYGALPGAGYGAARYGQAAHAQQGAWAQQ